MLDGIKCVSAFVSEQRNIKVRERDCPARFSFLAPFLARLELELVAIQKIPVRQEGSLRSGIQASLSITRTNRSRMS